MDLKRKVKIIQLISDLEMLEQDYLLGLIDKEKEDEEFKRLEEKAEALKPYTEEESNYARQLLERVKKGLFDTWEKKIDSAQKELLKNLLKVKNIETAVPAIEDLPGYEEHKN